MKAGRRLHRAGRRPGAAGFTVIEMMVVLAIIVVIVALVAPSFRDMIERQRVRGIATEMAADLNFARSEAVRRNSEVFFKLGSSSSASCYALFTVSGLGSCACTRSVTCSGVSEEIRTQRFQRSIGAAVSATTTQTEVRFQPGLGFPSFSDFRAEVRGRQSTAQVHVGATGRVSMCTPDGSLPGLVQCP